MVNISEIRQILGRLDAVAAVAGTVGEDDDLFEKGLDSFASVQLMLALEEHYDVEFPDHLLNRRSFSSLRVIRDTMGQLVTAEAA